jgi:hypothetical protein
MVSVLFLHLFSRKTLAYERIGHGSFGSSIKVQRKMQTFQANYFFEA